MTYNEVGIIDMVATIVDGSGDTLSYLGTENVFGYVNYVGRFYPNLFRVTETDLLTRVLQACTPESSFT